MKNCPPPTKKTEESALLHPKKDQKKQKEAKKLRKSKKKLAFTVVLCFIECVRAIRRGDSLSGLPLNITVYDSVSGEP